MTGCGEKILRSEAPQNDKGGRRRMTKEGCSSGGCGGKILRLRLRMTKEGCSE